MIITAATGLLNFFEDSIKVLIKINKDVVDGQEVIFIISHGSTILKHKKETLSASNTTVVLEFVLKKKLFIIDDISSNNANVDVQVICCKTKAKIDHFEDAIIRFDTKSMIKTLENLKEQLLLSLV